MFIGVSWAGQRTREYRTEYNKGDDGLESSGKYILLAFRWVMRRFEAALRDRRNKNGAYPHL